MCSLKKGFLRNFSKFTGKHLCERLLKKSLWHWCFPVNFAKFLRTPFLQNTSRRLLLKLKGHLVTVGIQNIFYSVIHQLFTSVIRSLNVSLSAYLLFFWRSFLSIRQNKNFKGWSYFNHFSYLLCMHMTQHCR